MKILEQTAEKLELEYYPPYKSLGLAMIGTGVVGLILLLFIRDSTTLFPQILLSASIVVGAWLATSAVITWSFDKSQDKIQLRKSSIRVRKVVEHRLSSISSIQVEQNPSVYLRNGARHKTWRIVLVLTDLTSVSLTSDYSFYVRHTAESLAHSIQQFLDD